MHSTALDINSFTSVRMLADRVGTTEVLQYQRSVLHVFRVCFAPAPYICWSNCNFSDTVGLSPQICKGNHGEPWAAHDLMIDLVSVPPAGRSPRRAGERGAGATP